MTDPQTRNPVDPGRAELELGIDGMHCASCVARIERALQALPEVDASVNLATEQAHIVYNPALLDARRLLQTVVEAGYQPRSAELQLRIGGMSCANCVGRVERALQAVPGVLEASVNLATERAQVRYTPATVQAPALVVAVQAAGYQAELVQAASAAAQADAALHKQRQLDAMRGDLVLALLLALPVLALSMGADLSAPMRDWLQAHAPWPAFWGWVQALLASVVVLGPGRRFWKPGWIAWRHLAPDMNALVATGVGAAWGYSLLALFAPTLLPGGQAQLYFDSAAVVLAAVLGGKYLEELAKGRASTAIRGLARLQVRQALVRRDGADIELPIEQVQRGDLVVVRPGDAVAVDGEVLEGSSTIDESMLSGEPLPVFKQPGDSVRAGTVNQQGLLLVRAAGVGEQTLLAQIIRLVEQAQGGKLPIQRVADRVVRVFSPIVLGIALLTFVAWLLLGTAPALPQALTAAVAVLVVACPCAMGLATPAAIMVGSGRAAELGVLFRKGEALEALAGVDTVLLDKTGTLTRAAPQLTALQARAGFGSDQVLAWAAAVETTSSHPLAQAVVQAALQRGLALAPVAAAQASPGLGASAEVDGAMVAVGALRYCEQLGVDASALQELALPLQQQGHSVVGVVRDGILVGVLGVSDPPRPEAAAVVAELLRRGLRVELVSGDHAAAVQAVAQGVGIARVHAEVLPQHKAEVVAQLQQEGRRIAFVGDGINDAPALAQADVGIALASGTDIAIQAADVTLVQPQLGALLSALQASTQTLRTIRGNLFWAFAYNVLLIPLATGAFLRWGLALNPMLAGLAMAMSSLFVLGNSLRLKRLRAWQPAKLPA